MEEKGADLLKLKKRAACHLCKVCQAVPYTQGGDNGYDLLLRFNSGFGSAFDYIGKEFLWPIVNDN